LYSYRFSSKDLIFELQNSLICCHQKECILSWLEHTTYCTCLTFSFCQVAGCSVWKLSFNDSSPSNPNPGKIWC